VQELLAEAVELGCALAEQTEAIELRIGRSDQAPLAHSSGSAVPLLLGLVAGGPTLPS